MIYQIDQLNLSYEYDGSSGTISQWLDNVTESRHGLLLETLEAFGSYMGDNHQVIVQMSYYDYPAGIDTDLPKKAPDDISYGMFRFVDAMSSFGGSIAAWEQAVQEVADWYTHNVKAYSQPTLTLCTLTGMQSRWDCSGFVTTCLQRYGLLKDVKWPPRSGAYADDPVIGKALEDGGFEKLRFSWDGVKPYDIIVYNGHIEIYNGLVNGKHTSWAWGAYHPTLPCSTAHQVMGYDYIWRCKGGGISTLFNKITGPDLGPSFNFGTIHANEGNQADVCKACYQAFRDAGCTDAAAKGICANIMEESMMNPRIATWDGSVNSGTFGLGGGLCGFYFRGALPELAKHAWGANGITKLNVLNEQVKNSGLPKPTTPVHPANTKHIMGKFGGFPFSLQQQLAYVVSILNSKNFTFIKSMSNAYEAALAWEKYYERPLKITDRWSKHGNKVLQLLKS